MKKIRRAIQKSPDATQRSLAARTGAHCPKNGFWLPEGGTGQPVFLFQGSIMPMGEAGPSVWVLQEGHVEPAYPLAGYRF
jgi:hypothetical protein